MSGSDFTYWVACRPLLKTFKQPSLHAESQTPHALPLAVFANPCQQRLALQASEGHCGLVYWTWLTGALPYTSDGIRSALSLSLGGRPPPQLGLPGLCPSSQQWFTLFYPV